MNYLDLVNDVLIRLREDEVTATTDTPYAKLIGKFVNDAKRIVDADATKGSPAYYNFNGVDLGDTQVDLYPIPDGVYNIYFNVFKPQNALSAGSDELLVPSEPVIKYAYAMAVAERGEDGGLAAQEATALADASLADHIAMAAHRQNDEYIWHQV
jgi:hypothetical protein